MARKIYPKLNKSCFLKGPQGRRLLIDLTDGQPFELEELQFRVLKLFNGSFSTFEIAKAFGLSKGNIQSFARELKRRNLIVFSTNKTNAAGEISLTRDVKTPYLYEVHLDITSSCNLSCKHCYQFPFLQGEKQRKDLGTKEIFDLIDQMHSLNVVKLVISGGEPFLRKDIVEIIDYAMSKGIFISALFTNGTVFNQEIIDYLAKNARPSLTVAISLDGDSAEIHDRIRGKGSFDKTVQFIKLLSALKNNGAKFDHVINTMITKYNLTRLNKMMRFLKGLGIDWWRMAIPRDQGCYNLHKKELGEDFDRLFSVYKKFISSYIANYKKRSNKIVSNIQIESFFRSGMVKEKRLNIFKADDPCCMYKKNAICIKPNGDVTPCTGFNAMVLGNIRSTPLKNIWYSKKTQSLKNLPINKINECAECEVYKFCGGGCRIIALAKTGSLYQKDEAACKLYKLFKREIFPIYEKEGIECIPASDEIT